MTSSIRVCVILASRWLKGICDKMLAYVHIYEMKNVLIYKYKV